MNEENSHPYSRRLQQADNLLRLIANKDKNIQELYVVIDTLQTNLRVACSYLNEEEFKAVNNHSFNWCVKWRPGDERK